MAENGTTEEWIDYREKAPPKKPIDTTAVIVGGVALGVCGVAAYYIYSRDKHVNEYLELAQEYSAKYQRFMSDEIITEDEQLMLDFEERQLSLLEEVIRDKGWWYHLLDKVQQILGIYVFFKITWALWKYVRDKWPPTGGHTFECPKCDYTTHSEDDLNRHVEEDHQPAPSQDPAYTMWDLLHQLSDDTLNLVLETAAMVSVNGYLLAENIGSSWASIPLEAKLMIIVVVLVLCALLIALSWGSLTPVLGPIAAAAAACVV